MPVWSRRKRGGIINFIISAIKKIFKGILAAINWLYPARTRPGKSRRINVWEDIDNFRQGFWLGGRYGRRKIRPKERFGGKEGGEV